MSFTIAEYDCPDCGRFEVMVERPAPDLVQCDCGKEAPWTISGPLGRVKLGSATQGKVAKAEKSTWTDTEMLQDRGALTEWRKKRKAVWEEHRWRQNRKDGFKGMA